MLRLPLRADDPQIERLREMPAALSLLRLRFRNAVVNRYDFFLVVKFVASELAKRFVRNQTSRHRFHDVRLRTVVMTEHADVHHVWLIDRLNVI